MNKYIAPAFYFGTLISSVGSFAFNIALIAFLLKNGFHLGHAALIIGLQRFVPVLVTGAWGHMTDRISPRKTVFVAESIAALGSIGLIFIWHGPATHYLLLVFLCVVRSVVVSFQIGSRSKITKLLSDETYVGNSRNAIWLNKATQGATLFGGLVAWFLIQHSSFETAIAFDGITFFVNGLIAIFIPINIFNPDRATGYSERWREKFKYFFRYNTRSAKLDILLVIPMMGTVAYMSRLAGSDQSWTGIYMAGYGLAVWTAGYLERGVTTKISSYPFWILMGLSFAALGFLPTPSILALLVLFIKDLSFWTVFHRISGYIQMDTPVSRIGSVMSARNCIITAVLTSGEVLVGAWSGIVPLGAESLFRGFFAAGVGLALFAASFRQPVLEGRPIL